MHKNIHEVVFLLATLHLLQLSLHHRQSLPQSLLLSLELLLAGQFLSPALELPRVLVTLLHLLG